MERELLGVTPEKCRKTLGAPTDTSETRLLIPIMLLL